MKIFVDELPKTPEECLFATEEKEGFARCILRKYEGVCTLCWPNPECRMLEKMNMTITVGTDCSIPLSKEVSEKLSTMFEGSMRKED